MERCTECKSLCVWNSPSKQSKTWKKKTVVYPFDDKVSLHGVAQMYGGLPCTVDWYKSRLVLLSLQ